MQSGGNYGDFCCKSSIEKEENLFCCKGEERERDAGTLLLNYVQIVKKAVGGNKLGELFRRIYFRFYKEEEVTLDKKIKKTILKMFSGASNLPHNILFQSKSLLQIICRDIFTLMYYFTVLKRIFPPTEASSLQTNRRPIIALGQFSLINSCSTEH